MSSLDRYTCEETFHRLDDYLDRELGAEDTRRVEEHVERCEVCAREFVFEANVLAEVRAKLRRLAVPPGLAARIAGALREAEGK